MLINILVRTFTILFSPQKLTGWVLFKADFTNAFYGPSDIYEALT